MRLPPGLRAAVQLVVTAMLATGCGRGADDRGAARREAMGRPNVSAQQAMLPRQADTPPSEADLPVPEVPATVAHGRPAAGPGASAAASARPGGPPKVPARQAAGALPPPVPGRPNLGGDQHPIIGAENIGTIEIPRIGLVHPIFEGTDLSHLHWGPGHWPGTALPGQVGNAVFAGHRVTHTRPFLDIDKLVPGDLIVFHVAGTTSTYRVTGHQIVGPDDVSIADPDFPRSTVTLLACHPKGSAARRYVVQGELVPAA